jgi:hypothetical protein
MPVPTECNITVMFINPVLWDHNGPHGPAVTVCATRPVITTCTTPFNMKNNCFFSTGYIYMFSVIPWQAAITS